MRFPVRVTPPTEGNATELSDTRYPWPSTEEARWAPHEGFDGQAQYCPALPPPVERRTTTRQEPTPWREKPDPLQTKIREAEEKVKRAFGLTSCAVRAAPTLLGPSIQSPWLPQVEKARRMAQLLPLIASETCTAELPSGPTVVRPGKTMTLNERWTLPQTFDGQAQRSVPPHQALDDQAHRLVPAHSPISPHPELEDQEHRPVPLQRGIPVTTPLPDQGSPETQACEGISACNSTVADPPATVLGVANDPGSAVIPDEASVQAQKPTHLNEQSNHIPVRQYAIKGEGAPPDTGQGGDMTEPIEAFVMTDTLDDSRVRASINAWKGLSEDADVAATESKADGSHVPGRKDPSEEFQGLRIDKPQAGATPGSFEVGAAASIGSVDTKTPNQGSRLGETTIASQLRCGKKPHAYHPGTIRALPLARTLAHSAQGHIRLLGRHYHPEYGG